MTRAENIIADVALDAMKAVRDRRDSAQNAMRSLSAVLADMRVAARALAAIDTTDNGWPAEAQKLDDEVHAIVKELAGLFVDETVKADVFDVTEGVHKLTDEVFTAETLIDLAAQKIVQRLRGSGGPGATFEEPMLGWLGELEGRIRHHFAEQEKAL